MCAKYLVIFLLIAYLPMPTLTQSDGSITTNNNPSCPLDFSVLQNLNPTRFLSYCGQISEGLRLVEAQYLHDTSTLYLPTELQQACWSDYQSRWGSSLGDFNLCKDHMEWMAMSCMNISTPAEFEMTVSPWIVNRIIAACNDSLAGEGQCTACRGSIYAAEMMLKTFSTMRSGGTVFPCTVLPRMFAAGRYNWYGPKNRDTATCLFHYTNAVTDKKKGIGNILLQLNVVITILMSLVILKRYGGCAFRRLAGACEWEWEMETEE